MCENHNPEKKDCFEYRPSGQPNIGFKCTVNGDDYYREVDPTMTLLQFLNKELKLFGTKEGCGEGECGACTIIMNKRPVNSCLILAIEAEGADITTVEGLSHGSSLSTLQKEFIEHDALQCGFCTPGMLMSARALLDRVPDPCEEDVKEALAGNFCRCTGYVPIIQAVMSASVKEKEDKQDEK